jgi:hypothetical protein
MTGSFVYDAMDGITIDIEASSRVLGAALEHEDAESVIGCAVLMALSALAQGGGWPGAALDSMWMFMSGMKEHIGAEQLM